MKNVLRKISALMLAMVMIVGILPTQIYANEVTGGSEETESNYVTIEPGKEYSVTISNDVREVWYKFTPAESGNYTIYSSGNRDSHVELFDSNMNMLAEDDDSGVDSNFDLQYKLNAGAIYYYKARMHIADNTGSFTVGFLKNVPATAINLNTEAFTVHAGYEMKLIISYEPELAAHEKITWTSSDEAVAFVNNYGYVKFLTEGTAVITATSENGLKDSCTVTVAAPMEMVVDQTYTLNTDAESVFCSGYKFTPTKSGIYRFYSFDAEYDTKGYLFDKDIKELKYDDDGGEKQNFLLDYELEAGETYYYIASPYNETSKGSFKFKLIEYIPTTLEDIYFTVDNVKKDTQGFTVTEGQEVTLSFKINGGTDFTGSAVTLNMSYIDQDGSGSTSSYTANYDQEKDLYSVKLDSNLYSDGREFYITDVSFMSPYDIDLSITEYNGKSLGNMYFFMGTDTKLATKTYSVNFDVLGESTEVQAISSRVTSLSAMGIQLPELPIVEGTEFLGWELIVNNEVEAVIKTNDQLFALNDIFDQGSDLSSITLNAVYDKNIVEGVFNYSDENGNPASKSIIVSFDKESKTTYAQWLELVLADGKLNDIKHDDTKPFDYWSIINEDPETVITSPYTCIELEAEYTLEGIVLGGVNLKDGDYLDNEGTVSETKSEGGYAYYKDGVLELNNYHYEGLGYEYDAEGYCAAIYAENDLEVKLVGNNSLINNYDYGEGITSYGNIIISGDGKLEIEGEYGIGSYVGDISINSGSLLINAIYDGIWGYEDISITDGNVNVYAGSSAIYADYNINITSGCVDIDAYYGIWCDYDDVCISDSIVNIDAVCGIYSNYGLTFNGGIVDIKATEYAAMAEYIELGDGVKISEPENGTIGSVEDYDYIVDGNGAIALDTRIVSEIVPVIKGAEDGKTYYAPITITVIDDNIESISINGEPVADINEPIILENNVDGTYEVVATDGSDNNVKITFDIKPITELSKPIEGKEISNVTSDDKEIIQSVIDAAADALDNNSWDEEEKDIIEKVKAEAEALIGAIYAAEEAINTESIKNAEPVNQENVITENKELLETAKADYEKALEQYAGNYSADEKKAIEDEIGRIDKALNVVVNVEEVESEINSLPESVNPEDEEAVTAVKTAKENYDALTDYEKSLVDEKVKNKLDSLINSTDSNMVEVYFDNSTNWEHVVALYEDLDGKLHSLGTVLPDENGVYAVKVPEGCKIQFQNYLPGQPLEAAPDEGFLNTGFLPVEAGKTYSYTNSGTITDSVLLGDINGDTRINAQDALLVLQHSAKITELVDDQALAADVNEDSKINANDALLILRYAAHIIDSF